MAFLVARSMQMVPVTSLFWGPSKPAKAKAGGEKDGLTESEMDGLLVRVEA